MSQVVSCSVGDQIRSQDSGSAPDAGVPPAVCRCCISTTPVAAPPRVAGPPVTPRAASPHVAPSRVLQSHHNHLFVLFPLLLPVRLLSAQPKDLPPHSPALKSQHLVVLSDESKTGEEKEDTKSCGSCCFGAEPAHFP